MQIYYDISPQDTQECVATVGMFDGVHCGHMSLINDLKAKAKELGMPSAVITFWPHPREVLQKDADNLKILTTLPEKLALLEKSGIDIVFVVTFSKEFSLLTPEEFITEYLLSKFNVKYLVMGYNHHFGSGQHSLSDYETLSRNLGLPCTRVAKFLLEEGLDCSSSDVRRHLSIGDVGTANRVLGHRYSISGRVVHGDAIGRGLGYPTANIVLSEKKKMLPADGVYAVYSLVGSCRYRGVLNIGYRPTISGREHRVELHLIDFDTDIYGQDVLIEFEVRLRGEERFENIDMLKRQISIDVEKSKKLL